MRTINLRKLFKNFKKLKLRKIYILFSFNSMLIKNYFQIFAHQPSI